MHFTQRSALLLTGVTAALALPLEGSGSTLNHLVARTARYDQSCSRKIPGSDKTYESKVRTAFTDASQLALVTQEGQDSNGNAFTESTAFSHYFGDGDKDQVKKMMQVIYNSRLPVDDNDGGQGYFIDIKCGSDQDDECEASVLAATSAKPGETSMVLCDRFFSANTVQTKQDLDSKKIGTRRGQWCQTGEKFPFFEVAGLTLFHEMTHLHVVGQRAGLTARPDPDGYDSSGTVDVYVKGGDDDRKRYDGLEPWQAARKLRQLWADHSGDESKYEPTTPTVENAESYAAAALEFYFLKNCEWDVILPE
ncbi:SGNH hydrolase [Apiospora marii]|uniref:SGNH hydrolase n=1 Tax=Apiospora marii TaxID=335849 RepID=A0ABR1RIZ5_9PEZI